MAAAGARPDAPPSQHSESEGGAAKAEWPHEAAHGRGLPAHCAEVGLVLQGGGALGAYQAGVYEALAEHEQYLPHWIAGISIGAINGAIIAGNPPSRRVEKLRAFWELITERITAKPFADGDYVRGFFNEWSALASVAAGIPGFFRPRMPPAWLQPAGTEGALSFYDTSPLRSTLEALRRFRSPRRQEICPGTRRHRASASVLPTSARATRSISIPRSGASAPST